MEPPIFTCHEIQPRVTAMVASLLCACSVRTGCSGLRHHAGQIGDFQKRDATQIYARCDPLRAAV